jgi:zinc resistance-associated protein
LRLTSEQESTWTGFQSALHDIAAARAEVLGNRSREPVRDARDAHPQDAKNDGALAALRAQVDEFAEKSTILKKLADALEPLYANLDGRQRKRTIEFLSHDWAAMYPNARWGYRNRR